MSYVYWTVHHCDCWRINDQLDVTILFHFLCAQHVSGINIPIIRSLRLFCWITTLVVLFLVRCVLEFRCGWVGVVSVLQASACNTDTTPTQRHRNSNTHRTKNNTTNVVIQQNSRKLLMMDILMYETYWAHKTWNKTASDIKLVFYSSTITMMHSPINIRFTINIVNKERCGKIVRRVHLRNEQRLGRMEQGILLRWMETMCCNIHSNSPYWQKMIYSIYLLNAIGLTSSGISTVHNHK